jgi:hypothetical protein
VSRPAVICRTPTVGYSISDIYNMSNLTVDNKKYPHGH